VNEAMVIIENDDVAEKAGTFKNDAGESINYETRKQSARLELNGFAYPFEIKLEKDQKPYKVGKYTLDLASMIEVNKKAIYLTKYPVLRAVASAAAK
jgi:hypothetical protein